MILHKYPRTFHTISFALLLTDTNRKNTNQVISYKKSFYGQYKYLRSCFLTIINGYFRKCPWCNGYRCSKWIRQHEFKPWTRLIAFHIALIPLGKV